MADYQHKWIYFNSNYPAVFSTAILCALFSSGVLEENDGVQPLFDGGGVR